MNEVACVFGSASTEAGRVPVGPRPPDEEPQYGGSRSNLFCYSFFLNIS